jgi:mannose-1-phosphate guanylyltransferase
MLHAIIMAGGSGTRFWPASRAAKPKQLLALDGQQTMLQATVDRLAGLVEPEHTHVVTNQRLVAAIAEQLPQLPVANILGEPCRRDTAPCIGLAAEIVLATDPDATMLVMPADHLIAASELFQSAVGHANQLVADDPGRIVTFGISPTYPAESFGYIERGAQQADAGSQPTSFQVTRFREKPTVEVAREYLESGQFYWNSGIFVWRAETILAALEEHQPVLRNHLRAIGEAIGNADYEQTLAKEFTAIEGISIDYAVMEHYQNVLVIEAPFDWDDVGHWQSLERIHEQDEDGNTIVGQHVGIGTRGTIVRSAEDHLVVTVGMEDCIIVHTPDATLVARRGDEAALRQIVERLKEDGLEDYL